MGNLIKVNFDKDDLSNRLYPLTEWIQKTAVIRRLTVKRIRDEVIQAAAFSKATLCMLEGAYHGQRKPPRLQLTQEIRLNAYFRKELQNEDLFICQMDLGLKVAS